MSLQKTVPRSVVIAFDLAQLCSMSQKPPFGYIASGIWPATHAPSPSRTVSEHIPAIVVSSSFFASLSTNVSLYRAMVIEFMITQLARGGGEEREHVG